MGKSPPKPVVDLVERFERDRKVFLSPGHKGEQLRAEFGQVYEQLLGKVIRLSAGHQAEVEEKPEGFNPPARLTPRLDPR